MIYLVSEIFASEGQILSVVQFCETNFGMKSLVVGRKARARGGVCNNWCPAVRPPFPPPPPGGGGIRVVLHYKKCFTY